MNRRTWVSSSLLLLAVFGIAIALAVWKDYSQQASAAATPPYEPMESVTVATAQPRQHQRSTTVIGTVVALRSITLRNEISGTVREVGLEPGKIVEKGTLLVALDVSVEEAELKALQAQAQLAETTLERTKKALENRAASEMELERARSERDVALAQMARTKAVIERKTIRAPFRAKIGMADVHPGQYLQEGTQLSTLQGVDDAVHVDFSVAQRVAAELGEGDIVEIVVASGAPAIPAKVVAVDSRVDPATRNAVVRARIENVPQFPSPGASVRVRVPVGPQQDAVAVPVSSLRKGPAGEHVFVVVTDKDGKARAQMRKVESSAMLGDEVLVASGLSAGEKVAAIGSFKLREGVLLSAVEETK